MSLPAAQITTQHLSPPPHDPPSHHRRRLSFKPSQNNSAPNSPPDPTTASWTSSIARHCKNGDLSQAILQFTCMRTSGCEPNHITLVTLLSGCARFPARGLSLGPSVHCYACKIGLDTTDVMVGTAVVDMYSKFSQMGSARLGFDRMKAKNRVSWNTLINGYMRNDEFDEAVQMFDKMPERDIVSWTVLIDGFVKKQRFEEALSWFKEMQMSGIPPDFVTIVCVLSAVANLGSLGLGLWAHRFLLGFESIRDNIRVQNALIDMYCRCGCVEFARQVFDKMSERSLVSWNSIIVGLAYNGHADEALDYFRLLQKDGFAPDSVSFTGALNACSHAGFVEVGLKLFESMEKIYKIKPRIEHYGCLVDLYSRGGRLKEALHVLDKMPMKPNEVIVGSLLAACRDCEDFDLAEQLMEYIYDFVPNGDSNYVLMSNIYAARGRWRGASGVRRIMKAVGLQKRPGISSVEVDGIIHGFMAGDKSHDDADSIYLMLECLSNEVKTFKCASEGIFSLVEHEL
ncbi:pentatricopeptide repeat-containing protein [Striga asiatica]|uniref:Pentatricopeptide repeat-containing protein n=1 Tax=Striga asiatica TaxID=4170 RepID=A0A5A7PUG8_STRAF|nr:pentatricopeptide repeat-containing protein [Striga asiatica]